MTTITNDVPGISEKKSVFHYLTLGLATLAGLWHVYTALTGIWPEQKPIHLLLFLLIIFSNEIDKDLRDRKIIRLIISALSFAGSLAGGLYGLLNYETIQLRLGRGDIVDVLFGIVITVVVMMAAARTLGYTIPIISIIFILYALFGSIMPGIFQHRGIRFVRLLTYIPFSYEGIMSAALDVSAKFIVLYIIFAAVLEVGGGGQFFIDISNSLLGHKRGGPAKTAVVASGLFGSISGSAIANVAGTGSFTIPMMKKTGYSSEFAGAVEAAASTGGQFTPPVLGSVAFIVAEMLGIGYGIVVIASVLPALLFYYCVFINVDMEAVNRKLIGLPKESLPKFWPLVKRGWYLLIPIFLLTFMLGVLNLSPQRSGVYAILASIVLSWFRKDTRIGLKKFLKSIQIGIKGSMAVVAACACSGIIVAVVTGTGLGVVFSRLIVQVSGGSLPIALFFTMVTTIILGMGMPTIPAYLIPAVMLVPALIEMGANPLAAHLFIVYFASMSGLTPPVALTSYTAAGVSGGNVWKTSLIAVEIAAAGFTLPYVFTFVPALFMLSGSFSEVAFGFVICALGLTGVSAAFRGRLFTEINVIERVFCFVAGILMIDPRFISDTIGFSLLAIVAVLSLLRLKKAKAKAAV